MDLAEVTIEDLGLSERVYESIRAESGLRTAADLMGLRDTQLQEIDMIGPRGIKEIRERCAAWLERIAENLAAQ
jgi:hypothetical protein